MEWENTTVFAIVLPKVTEGIKCSFCENYNPCLPLSNYCFPGNFWSFLRYLLTLEHSVHTFQTAVLCTL